MSRRTVVLFVALILAVAASFSVWRYLETVERDARAAVSEVSVFRATELIPAGTDGVTAFSSIEQGTALAESVVFEGSTILCTGPATPESDLDPAVCAANPSDLEALLSGTVSAGPISAGQYISQDMFVTQAQLDIDALSSRIPAGKVAVAINPGEVASVGGQIVPGDRVNVLATSTIDQTTLKALLANPETRDFVFDTGLLSAGLTQPGVTTPPQVDDEGEPIAQPPPEADRLAQLIEALPDNVQTTQTILQNVPVLAVGAQTVDSAAVDPAAVGETSVVLEVTVLEAERLELARQVAVLALALLPADDTYTPLDSEGAVVDELFRVLERLQRRLEEIDAE